MKLWNETVVERIERRRRHPAPDQPRPARGRHAWSTPPAARRCRRPRGIGLEELGVALNATGAVQVDAGYHSSVPGIFAVGDCSDHAGTALDGIAFDLTPVAIAEGRALAESLFNARPRKVNYDTIPTAIFACPRPPRSASRRRRRAPRPRGPDLPQQLPADVPHPDRQHHADHDEAGRRQGRPIACWAAIWWARMRPRSSRASPWP